MTAPSAEGSGWSHLRATELIEAGKALVSRRLERAGCSVTPPSNPRDGRLAVRTPSGRSVEVFVSTQRVGGYALWTKRRLVPAPGRLAALVLLDGEQEPQLFLVPSTDWLAPAPPLKDPDYVGRKSEPEYGIEIGRSALPGLRRYAWTDARQAELLR